MIAITTTACQTKPLNAQQLMAGCETVHAPNHFAAGIRAEKERNPVQFQDQIVGHTVCIAGHIHHLVWPTEQAAHTAVIIKAKTETGVACRLKRPDAATIEQGLNMQVSGQISSRTVTPT